MIQAGEAACHSYTEAARVRLTIVLASVTDTPSSLWSTERLWGWAHPTRYPLTYSPINRQSGLAEARR